MKVAGEERQSQSKLVPRRTWHPSARLNPLAGVILTRTYWLRKRAPITFLKVLSEPTLGAVGLVVTTLRSTGASLNRPEAGPIISSIEINTLHREWVLVPESVLPPEWKELFDRHGPPALPEPPRSLPPGERSLPPGGDSQ